MNKKLVLSLLAFQLLGLLFHSHAFAADPLPNVSVNIGDGTEQPGTSALSLILLITVLSVAPGILVLMTSFTRIVIVLGFVRTSLGTQQMPPNQVLIGLAMFLTFFIMAPTLSQVNTVALQPYLKGELTQTQALTKAAEPMKKFMFNQTRQKDLLLFMEYTKTEKPKTYKDIPITVMVPAYALSELRTSFQMGFMIFIPFLIIDMVVASTLMAMGMMMLPPVMISLPFKILLFVLVDGWYLIIKSLLLSFNT
ncbi:flagellar biosynthetic protein FliP [Paenibacillus baekrokdamisoli]|uniref:Flagellar biosynthetic protein FliP n=1 Tax=Paenibacillus baekrokdamisoli TaxID=1712516 RepID=A0A3G9J543_9BACL|nr:flagellar type III secretion system pore protein FliP [Paenibacillus baekrokdamisoli]MBB3069785.1 flagellar biosynthetic protein FliP [Paenibacillus baekrokdamisoli]BBH20861.1 flagellar biosynthetic protein FliP [Paenibacillus baekrokdamisoli]